MTLTIAPLSFALGVSPGPAPGSRDPEGRDALETLARDGVNLARLPRIAVEELEGVTPGAGPLPPSVQYVADYLDWADRAGRAARRPVYVAINLAELSAQDGSATRARWMQYIVHRFRDHPATGVWKMLDEPNNPYTPDEKERRLRRELRRGYAHLRELDSGHPAWVTQAPQPARRVTTPFFRAYRDAADIYAVDLYPISEPLGKHSGIRNRFPSAVGDFADRLATVARERTAANAPAWVWMVLQGAAWSGVIPRDEQRRYIGPVLMQPTAAMLRYMTYQSIIHGAQGLLYFGMNVGLYPEMQPYGWDWGYWRGTIAPVLRELRSPALSTPLAAGREALPARAAAHPRVDTLLLPASGGVQVLLATRSEQRTGEPLEAAVLLPLPNRQPAMMEVCFEGRVLRSGRGAPEDTFLPHQVHVYRFSTP